MEHDAFMEHFLKGLRRLMNVVEENNTYSRFGLKFACEFMLSFDGDTHPILESTFEYFLETTSVEPYIRSHICQFIGMLLDEMNPEEANIDDELFDKILSYMTERLSDRHLMVRVQAIYALKRLQRPEDPNDKVIRLYSIHLSKDVAIQVRKAVLTSIGLNALTLPIVLDRLSDINDGVRRLLYLQLGNYPVESYTSSQLSEIIKHGLKDDNESVRKSFYNFSLCRWFKSCNEKCLSLLTAFKLENVTSEDEFQEIVGMLRPVLFIIFE